VPIPFLSGRKLAYFTPLEFTRSVERTALSWRFFAMRVSRLTDNRASILDEPNSIFRLMSPPAGESHRLIHQSGTSGRDSANLPIDRITRRLIKEITMLLGSSQAAVARIAKQFILGAALLVPSLSAEDRPLNQLTSKEAQDGWVLLFDGKSTANWRNYKSDKISAGWKVEDGTLHRAGKNAGDIITVDKYDAFELVLEYKIGKAGNSGLMFHVTEEGQTPWRTGPEIQIQDNKDGHDPQKAGWLYQLYKADTDATKPTGEWNELRIIIHPKKCEQFMNGVKYCEYVKGSDDWNERVAKSKFSKFPKFGKATTGHICLQDHGDDVAFRNIRIKKLKVD
jgi:hypothetical protein